MEAPDVSVTSSPQDSPLLDFALVVGEPRDLVRHGVRLTLEGVGARVVADVSTGAAALDVTFKAKPDMVIIAATPPDMAVAEVTRRVLAGVPRCQVLVLGDAREDDEVIEALQEGASGHLPALCTAEELVARVRLVRFDGVPLSRGIAKKLLDQVRALGGARRPSPGVDVRSLSAREVEVLRLLPTGMENDEIARALSVSPTTVKKHVSSILDKLDLDNRVQAAVRAVRAGIEPPVPRRIRSSR
jgi:DNA-binding NarL/FixJ family response regulator